MRRQLGVAPSGSTDVVIKSYVDGLTFGGGGGGGGGGYYATLVGDNSSTSVTVTHNLGTRDVVISVYDASTYEEVNCDKFKTTSNTVTLVFASAPATNAYRCAVVGAAAPSGGIARSVSTISTSANLGATALTDYVAFIASGGTPTLPTAVGNTNRYTIKNIDTSSHSVLTTSGQTIDGSSFIVLAANTSVDLISDGTNWWVV